MSIEILDFRRLAFCKAFFIIRKMKIGYTARNTFDPSNGETWTKYIEWCKLLQLEELISLDASLCESIVNVDFKAEDTWDNVFDTDDPYFTDAYNSIDFILAKINEHKKFNLLAIVFAPKENCKNFDLNDFEFIGYDLLDQDHSVSALVNCGGFEETFKNTELNKNGLVNNYERVNEIQENLLKNNEDEYHADTNIWAVWRHKTIGRI